MFPLKKAMFIRVVVLLLVGFALMQALPARAANSNDPSSPEGIIPTLVSGNPTLCAGGVRFNSPVSGTYPLDAYGNTVTIQITDTPNGPVFTWTVSPAIRIDTVVAKGGNQGANIYDYTGKNPRPSTDGNLHAPTNTGNSIYAGLSHIDFCFHYQLTATKTANATQYKTINWTIVKDYDGNYTGFAGDNFPHDYRVTVTKDETFGPYVVAGTITVKNPTPFTVNFNVSDSVGGTAATVDCDLNTAGNQSSGTLTPGQEIGCTYSANLAGAVNGTNTATIASATAGVDGTTATAPYTFGTPILSANSEPENITVTDTNGENWSTDEGTSWEYTKNFTCPTTQSSYTNGVYTAAPWVNTATINETQESDIATVNLTCYAPIASKTADTRYVRDWTWTIVKTADQSALKLSAEQLFDVNYEVTVSGTYGDSDFEVYGTISVQNPHPSAAMSVVLTDLVGSTPATIEQCTGGTYDSGSGVLTIPAGITAECEYSANLGDTKPANGTNTATVKLNNIAFSATATYTFGNTPTTETDECVTVKDDYGTADTADDKAFGTFCATVGDQTETFSYTRTFGPYTCGDTDKTDKIVNIASFVTNDNGETGSDDHTVTVTVPACQKGCTLTQGYWKTHSHYGPAPKDDSWFLLGDVDGDGTSEGAAERFFLSGQTYYQVLWTPPAGNVYYNLAHQYIAAKLNILNGAASTTAVTAAITWAESFFATKSPTSTLTKTERTNVLKYAGTLDAYNNGLTGPGHCSEGGGSGALGLAETITTIFLPTITTR